MDEAAYHDEQLMLQQEAERVLAESTKRPLTVDEAKLLAWAGNLNFKQENKHAIQG